MSDPESKDRHRRRIRNHIAKDLKTKKYRQRVVNPKAVDDEWSVEEWYREWGSE